MEIIESIRFKMRQRKLTTTDIAQKCGISKYTVFNILQGKSHRFDYISKIAKFLDIPLLYPIQDIDSKNEIKLKKYFLATSIIDNLTNSDDALIITKNKLEEFIFRVYKYILINPNENKLYNAYAEGLLEKYTNK
jgi:transcriptional regulator with XRE-family HTH domain